MRTERPARPGNRTERPDKTDKRTRPEERRPNRDQADQRAAAPRKTGTRPPGKDGGRDQIYGRNAVLAALNGPRHVETVYLADTVGPDPRIAEIRQLAEKKHIKIQTVPRAQIENYVGKVNHQGVLAIADRFAYRPLKAILERPGAILVLDHITDPQNLGTLLRTGAAFDIAGIVIPSDRAVGITPAVVNASAGAIENIPVAQVVNLKRAVTEIKDAGRWTIGLDTGDDSQSIYEVALPMPACLILGSEGKGISRQLREIADMIVAIPIGRSVESLNVATAGSIVLFELSRLAYRSGDAVEVASDSSSA